jgi:hypothetical protein
VLNDGLIFQGHFFMKLVFQWMRQKCLTLLVGHKPSLFSQSPPLSIFFSCSKGVKAQASPEANLEFKIQETISHSKKNKAGDKQQ